MRQITSCVFIFTIVLLSIIKCSAQCIKEPLTVYLSGDFNKEHVELIVDGKTVFNQTINVNESIGVEIFSLTRTICKQKISLKVNGVLLHTMWLDHKKAFMKGIQYSKTGITIGTEFFINKLPLLD